MERDEFKVGAEFFCGDKRWRCTDVGTRAVLAIELDDREDRTWFDGPPYAVVERVFDEYDQKGCTLT
jgi:hypothetical protein